MRAVDTMMSDVQQPGTGPVRKQKQQRKSHCSASSGAASGSVSNQKGGNKTPTYKKLAQQDLESGVFHSDTQKSMCVKVQPGNNLDQTVGMVSTSSASTISSSQGSRTSNRPNRKGRKHNHHSARRAQAADIVEKAIADCRLKEVDKHQDAFDLDNVVIGLAAMYMDQNRNLKSCDDWYRKNCTGLPFPFTHEGCTKNVYGFFSERLLGEQVKAAYEYFVKLSNQCQHEPKDTEVPKENVSSETACGKVSEGRINTTNIKPRLPRKVKPRTISLIEKSEPTTSASSCGSSCSKNTKLHFSSVRKGKAPTPPNSIVDVAPLGCVPDENVMFYVKHNKEEGTYSKGRGKMKLTTPELAKGIEEVNTCLATSKRLTFDVPVSEQIVDSIAIPKTPEPKPREIPSGFIIRKKPCFLLRCIYSDEVFDSKLKFNHNSKSLRKAAKAGRLNYTHIPDNCVIPSLFSYLTRRRDIAYPDYKTKITHLHKLAKAWENDEMPLKDHKATSEMLNNYYLTIAKVANCTDVDLIVAEHEQDQASFWSRLRLRLTKSKITSE